MAKRLTVKRVQHGVAGTVGGSGAAVCLATFAKVERLATERALVDFAVVCAGEREAKIFELNDCSWCFAAHVLDGVCMPHVSTDQYYKSSGADLGHRANLSP